MKKNVQKMLSLLLAFIMVFSVVVPVMATEDSPAATKVTEAESDEAEVTEEDNTSVGKPEEESFSIDIEVTKNGLLNGDDKTITVGKAKSSEKNWENVDEVLISENGKSTFSFELEASTDYRVSMDADEVSEGTTHTYYFSTDKDSKIVPTKGITPTKGVSLANFKDGKLETFKFELKLEKTDEVEFPRVETLDLDGQLQGYVQFTIYKAKVKDNAFVFANKTYLPGDKIEDAISDENGYYSLENTEGATVENDAANRNIVVFERDGVIVAYADLNNDDRVILKAVPAAPEAITVKVYGDNGFDAPMPIAGAEVAIYKNITELFGKETYSDEPIATAITNAQGEAVFTDVNAVEELRVLVPTEGNSPANYTTIQLVNKIKVEKADGWILPEDQAMEIDGNEYAFILKPLKDDYNFRIGANNRYATSVEVAKEAFTNNEETVIIASGQNFADSLVASSLVGALDHPLVLTANKTLSSETKAYLKDVKANKVIIVGKAIDENVHSQLEKMGMSIVTLGGENRYETSEAVMRYLVQNGSFSNEVLVASGNNFADALVASVPAALNKKPILLTAKDSFAAENNKLLKEFNVQKVTVIGGESSVSAKAFKEINVAEKERLDGNNRQLTSMKVADAYFTQGGKAIVVDGTNFPDAISAGQLAYKLNAPILLSQNKDTLGKDLKDFIKDNKMTDITIIGGPNSVKASIELELKELIVK